jgi:hypothetical protein
MAKQQNIEFVERKGDFHKKRNARTTSTQPHTVTKQQPISLESDEEDN